MISPEASEAMESPCRQADLHRWYADRGGEKHRPCIRHHGASPVEVPHVGRDFRSLLVPEVSSGSAELSGADRRSFLNLLVGWDQRTKDGKGGESKAGSPPFIQSW